MTDEQQQRLVNAVTPLGTSAYCLFTVAESIVSDAAKPNCNDELIYASLNRANILVRQIRKELDAAWAAAGGAK